MNGLSLEPGGDEQSIASAACLLDALSDASRLRIVQHLLLGEHKVVDLTAHLGLAQSTVSGHLACLRGCGVVEAHADGRSSVYRLTHPTETAELLESVERLLHATGFAASLCPVHLDQGHLDQSHGVSPS